MLRFLWHPPLLGLVPAGTPASSMFRARGVPKLGVCMGTDGMSADTQEGWAPGMGGGVQANLVGFLAVE